METTTTAIPIPVRGVRQINKALDLPEEYTPEAEQRLIAFCDEQISKMAASASIGNAEGQPGFYELNKALGNHQPVNLSLISLYALAKVEYSKAKEAYEDWYAEKYIDMRDEMNPRSLSTTKWYGAKEIEMSVRHRWKDEFRKYNDEQNYAEQKVALLRRLLESWASHQFVLSRLCKNISAEMSGEGLE